MQSPWGEVTPLFLVGKDNARLGGGKDTVGKERMVGGVGGRYVCGCWRGEPLREDAGGGVEEAERGYADAGVCVGGTGGDV